MSHVWYNMREISPASPEQLEIIDSMAEELVELIKKEVQAGIPYHRIVIGRYVLFLKYKYQGHRAPLLRFHLRYLCPPKVHEPMYCTRFTHQFHYHNSPVFHTSFFKSRTYLLNHQSKKKVPPYL